MRIFRKNSCEAEVLGLREIKDTNLIRTPDIVSFENNQLSLEWIETSTPHKIYWENLGRSLANMHKVTRPFFGWNQDGTIGISRQINPKENNWADFFMKHRLEFQMSMLRKHPFYTLEFESLFQKAQKRISDVLKQVPDPPCLLHGDLWSGNVLCDVNQNPVLIDPAIYYGHSETDIAMMKLFGGFDDRTFDAYDKILPKVEGWEIREKIYQLYHVLNHANIFGAGYLRQAQELIQQLQ